MFCCSGSVTARTDSNNHNIDVTGIKCIIARAAGPIRNHFAVVLRAYELPLLPMFFSNLSNRNIIQTTNRFVLLLLMLRTRFLFTYYWPTTPAISQQDFLLLACLPAIRVDKARHDWLLELTSWVVVVSRLADNLCLNLHVKEVRCWATGTPIDYLVLSRTEYAVSSFRC